MFSDRKAAEEKTEEREGIGGIEKGKRAGRREGKKKGEIREKGKNAHNKKLKTITSILKIILFHVNCQLFKDRIYLIVSVKVLGTR